MPSNTAPQVTGISPIPEVIEDTPVPLPGMGVTDVDGDDQTLAFTATGGTVTLGTAGISFGGAGNSTASFTASGTLASIIGVNDDPTFTGLPTSITVIEDADIAYLSNALSDATFADIDAEDNDVTLILSVSAGTLNFANPQGVITITGFGTPTAYLVGTVANFETYLSTNTNAAYFPPLNLSGANAATLTVSANDGGNTGIGGGTTVQLNPGNEPLNRQISNSTHEIALSYNFKGLQRLL